VSSTSTDLIDLSSVPMIKGLVFPKRVSLPILVLLALELPAHGIAYGDPSGGFLFQMLTPLAAVLWGGWLIFAGGVRKKIGRLVGRFRSATPDDDGESLKSTSEAD
jgi:hypothetical protein